MTGQGTITSSGYYSAPSSVTAQNQTRGCQELPNNSPFNIPVASLPVDPHSSRWLTRAAEDGTQYVVPYHNLKFYSELVSFYDNPVTNTTQQELMHFYYLGNSNGYQDTNFPLPPERTLIIESGRSIDAYGTGDRHLFTVNNATCQETEIYNLYVDFRTVSFSSGNPTSVTWTTHTVWPVPQSYMVNISGGTGAWAGANGSWRMTITGNNSGTLPFDSSQWGAAPSGTIMTSMPSPFSGSNYNSQAGQKFSPTSYAQLGGVDAAGMPMSALSLKLEEWYAATQAGRSDLGHAIRTTMSNSYLSARNTWPATLYAGSVAGFQNVLLAATNGGATTFTTLSDISQSQPCDNYTYTPGCQFYINIAGLTGAWAAANGDQTATAIDNYHFSIPLNSSSFGSLPSRGYFVADFFPYGATIRLSSSVDLSQLCTSTDLNNWCPYAKVYLQTLQNYGMVVADGTSPSDNWDNGTVSSEFHPNVLEDAAYNIRYWSGIQPIEGYLQVVNRSSQQLSNNLATYQQTNTNRTYVTVCGSAGCASDDVILQGTTVGTDHERLTIAANASYQLNVWVNGNSNTALAYSMNSGIPGATVSSSGLLTMPNCTAKEQGMITVTSADQNALPLYIEATCLPVGADGSYRLALGNYTGDYTDSTGEVWYGSWQNNGFNNSYEMPGLVWGTQNGTWQGLPNCANDTWTGADSQLYSRSTNISNDTRVDVIVPNGQYTVTLYGEPGFGGFGNNNTCGNTAGQNVYDWTVQGQTAASWIDGYVLTGMQPYNGYTLTSQTTVSDNLLSTVGRMRVYGSTYGMSWSSLLITPGGSLPLTITTSALPNGTVGTAYSASLTASYGMPPYTWSLASGSGPLPQGLALATNGVISGTPTTAGTYPFTAQVTDSNMNTATKALSIVVSTQGSFRLVSTPVLLSVAQGNQGKATVTSIISNGFNSSIALSASGLPSGGVATFSPSTLAAPGNGTSSLIIAVASNTPTGTYPITITGNGGGLQETTAITLNVTAGAGNFMISASPTSLSVTQGTQGASTITTAISGNFNSSIALSATGLPSGASATFNPTSIAAPGNGSSNITISVASNTPTGTYPITVQGNGGGVQQNATVTLTVVSPPSFTISASPTTLAIAQGNQGTSTITTAPTNGFNSSIALSASGLPSGATASFNPGTIPAPGNGSSALTISVASGTPTGNYPITVTANGGGVQQTTTITLTVAAGANFTLSVSPTSQTVNRGSRTTYTATLTAVSGFNNSVSLSISGCPPHASCSFTPSSLTPPGTSTLTASTGSRTRDGNYTLTITGTSGSLQHSTTVSLTVVN